MGYYNVINDLPLEINIQDIRKKIMNFQYLNLI